jgi:hypothetical protein
MQTRNPIYNKNGDIDCEIEHPKYGWMPFTASSDDPEQHGRDIFAALVASGNVAPYIAPVINPTEALAQERSQMRCRAAAMRLVLHRQGLLTTVQAIADSDPEASIVFEYEPEFSRNDPFITSLGGPSGFTPEQIDDLFRAAMAL